MTLKNYLIKWRLMSFYYTFSPFPNYSEWHTPDFKYITQIWSCYDPEQTWAQCGPPDVPELQIPTFLTVWARLKSPHYWLCGLGITGVAVQQHLEGHILPTPDPEWSKGSGCGHSGSPLPLFTLSSTTILLLHVRKKSCSLSSGILDGPVLFQIVDNYLFW